MKPRTLLASKQIIEFVLTVKMTSKNLMKACPFYIVDNKTPRHTLLSARYKQSFAYKTMCFRLPGILNNIAEDISINTENIIAEFGEEIRKDVQSIISRILKLKYKLENDCVMKTFDGNERDKSLWNDLLKELNTDSNTFLRACWLYAECYVYRRLYCFFENHTTLKAYDYFSHNKRNAFVTSTDSMLEILRDLKTMETHISDDYLKLLLKLNLWGNRCDLSISSGKEVKLHGNPFELVRNLDTKILVDQSSKIIECLKSADCGNPVIIEMICDNAGYELFTDFILADYLIESKLASAVRFNLKAIPWFISDATINDFRWSLQFMKDHTSSALRDYGKKWQTFVVENKFQVANLNYFWTSPYEYYRMPAIDPDLYARLSKAHLVIFKGDLNYRKLISDFSWDSTESFTTCLRGFQPTNVCSLRTVKADLICGLAKGQADILDREDKDWMTTGDYGTIQFSGK
ncbi:damage-control phosphatase ARMT1-like isoform X1 [Anastrepha ludens]|uniref:damage-control phosphatase ARMT1-like isoform X1 n=2 Tax=Anastrepha ludens TaxID=28586 RepID=UPI0023B1D465|nr:damage-control phosphatase ARMT1-like isoform X1 [Anastrepha ludens]